MRGCLEGVREYEGVHRVYFVSEWPRLSWQVDECKPLPVGASASGSSAGTLIMMLDASGDAADLVAAYGEWACSPPAPDTSSSSTSSSSDATLVCGAG